MDLIKLISSDLSLTFWIIVGLLFVLFVFQLFYYIFILKKPYSYEYKRNMNVPNDSDFPSVSVVIVSKNESDNLANNLPSILDQDYPDFEVIVVNMGSTDETDMLLEGLSLKYSNLYHTFVPSEAENINEKKLALTLGIKAAKNDVLLFTEAYCQPVSNKWIQEYAQQFNNGYEIVLGFNRVDINKKFPMRRFIKFDNLIHHVKFLSLAILKKPFMGLNRNLAYKRSVFFDVKGFSSVLSFEDGEDDLFINRIAKGRKVGVVLSTESITKTEIVTNYSIWRNLKSKYLYSKRFYNGFSSKFFAFESFTKYLFYIASLLCIIYGVYFQNFSLVFISSMLFIVRFIIVLDTINKLNKIFDVNKIHINLILYELFQPLSNYKIRRRIKKRKR